MYSRHRRVTVYLHRIIVGSTFAAKLTVAYFVALLFVVILVGAVFGGVALAVVQDLTE